MGARDLVGADLIFTSTKHYNRKCLTIYFKKTNQYRKLVVEFYTFGTWEGNILHIFYFSLEFTALKVIDHIKIEKQKLGKIK